MVLTEVGKKIDINEIKKLETMVNESIPVEYSNFLLENNGGMPEEDLIFDFLDPDVENYGTTGSDIHYFFNTDEICEWYSNLLSEEYIPPKCLPIACDSFDNVIMLNLKSGLEYGTVCFADHESTRLSAPFWTIVKVAQSFSDFLERLKPMFDE